MKTIHETEVTVVGAGAVGCSIAYWLAKRGMNITQVDKHGPGAGTTTANFGLIWTSIKEPHTYMELSVRSSWLWPQMVEELGEDVDLRQDRGGIKLCLTQADYDKHAAILERQRRSPLAEARMLSPQETIEMQPGVSSDIAGAVWSPYDGDCNPIKWNYALARGCKRLGVTVMNQTEVTGFELHPDDNRVTGILTDRGRIATQFVVNSAGPWAAKLAEMVDLTIGLYPERGQMLITEAAPMICPIPMSTVRQDPHGQFYLGATMEDVGFDLSTTAEAARKIARNAVRMVPYIRNLSVVRQFSGLRPMPRDGLPFLGPVPHVPGYYIATGHSGITLSPIHGKIISDLIVEGETDIPIDDYDPLRYDKRSTRPAGPPRSGH